jgi:hypothetical protein
MWSEVVLTTNRRPVAGVAMILNGKCERCIKTHNLVREILAALLYVV